MLRASRLIILFAALHLRAQTNAVSPEDLYSRCQGSVVTIFTFDAKRAPIGQGSGFVIADNRVVTNYHVVAGSASASVVFNDGSVTIVRAVIAASGPKDLVILEADTGNRPPLALGNELQLKVGEAVYAIGAPRGLTSSLSSGLVSAFRQDQGQFLIQITAPIAPGSSGGPLLNSRAQVVGVTTSRLKDGSFGFAAGAGDLQQLLKVPLTMKAQLSDLTGEEDSSPNTGLEAVQALYDQNKYEEAKAAFESLPETAKATFDAQLLLCKIQQARKAYTDAIQACESAIKAKPTAGDAYGVEALSHLMLGNTEQAESAASTAAKLSNDLYYKKLLSIIHYSEEKYTDVPKELPADSDDTFVLTLLAGAAFHTKDYDSFNLFRKKITALKAENGWSSFIDGMHAERDLSWDVAVQNYKKCDSDSDFIDPICSVSVVRAEVSQANYGAAKSDMDRLTSGYPTNQEVLKEGIFLDLLLDNRAEADRLHQVLRSRVSINDDATDCLYYYGRSQPKLASSYCLAAIRANETSYGTWSNAGYVALDNYDFQTASGYFAKASQLFYSSKDKHTVTQELDLSWGLIIANYYSGNEKVAKNIYHALKKEYPLFLTSAALKQLPLVWSDNTVRLIDAITTKFK